MQQHDITNSVSQESVLRTNSVLRNTYILLSLTLIFSGITAWFAMATNAAPVGFVLMLVGYFGLFFLTNALRNSPWGIVAIFALTGFMGYTLGPILNFYIHGFSNGSQLVMTALGGTGVIFFALSGYALTTRKNFNYLGAFIGVGALVAFLAGIGAMVFNIPGLSLAVSAAFILISSAYILFQTSLIINGGERNYIVATVSLYVAIYNLFVSLLSILGALSGNRN